MKIKEKPEDFIVKEIYDLKIKDKGKYLYFLLKKKNYNTLDALKRIAATLHAPIKWFNFAGNKDKKAVSEQAISIENVKNENVEKLKLKDIELSFIGSGDERIYLGNLKGNEFIIKVRDITREESGNFNNKSKNREIFMPNYFGEQRFSTKNIDVGRAIVKKDFKQASELLNLKSENNNYVEALQKVNNKILRLYVHAYQSYIWNESIKELLESNIGDIKKMPIVGFGTEFKNRKIKHIVCDILKKEGMGLRDFIIREIPRLSEEGSYRRIFVKLEDFSFENINEKEIKLHFKLPKGSYATVAVDYLFN